jgi:hypothetical protein
MSRRHFVLSPEFFSRALDLPADCVVLDLCVDHRRAVISVIVNDPSNTTPLREGETTLTEPLLPRMLR